MTLPPWVLEEILALGEGFTGKVEVNFFMGGVTNVNVAKSIKRGEPARRPLA